MLKINETTAPFLHTKKNVTHSTWFKISALVPIIFSAIYFFKFAAVERFAVVLAGCFLAEAFARYTSGRKPDLLSGDSLWEGLLLTMLLPASLPLPICFAGGFVMILFFRELFGGPHQNLCSPVLAAVLFLTVSFPILIFNFSSPQELTIDIHPYLQWQMDGTYRESLGELFVGLQTGPLGSVSVLTCLIGALFLLVRRVFAWELPFIFLGTYAFLNGLFGFPLELSILGGSSFFLAFFILPMGPYVPHKRQAKWLYVIIAAALSSWIERYSFYQEGMVFGIMLAGSLTPWINRLYRFKIQGSVS